MLNKFINLYSTIEKSINAASSKSIRQKRENNILLSDIKLQYLKNIQRIFNIFVKPTIYLQGKISIL